jgi:hypothetical protein
MQESHRVDSPIPRALLRSPRRVRRKAGTLGPFLVGRILTAPLLAVCVALLGAAVLEPILVFLIPAQPARVIAVWGDLNDRRGASYYITYRFDRSGFTGRDELFPDEYRTLQVGQTVKAHLIRLGPVGYSVLDRPVGAYARYRSILWFGALFASAIGAVFFHTLWFAPRRALWLTRYGEATFGAVVNKGVIQTRRRHLYFTLTYQFKVRGMLQVQRMRVSAHRYDSAELKDLVIVLFDPARPNRNIVYEYCDFIAW